MNDTILPGMFRSTSRLGFGTSGLAGELSYKESIGLLEAAFASGIRHFDTAPLYGAGASEKLLGDFAVRRRDEITLTTKFGLMAPRGKAILLRTKSLIRPLLRRIPGLKTSLARSVAGLRPPPNYSSVEMEKSLCASLRAMRCKRIDLLLLHEGTEADMSDELRRALDGAVSSGLIGAWGFGGSRDKVDRLVACEIAPRVLQFEWSVLSNRLPSYGEAFCITYGSISAALADFKAYLKTVQKQRQWSEDVGVDFQDPLVLPRLLVGASLAANPNGIVLFSSKKVHRIREIASMLQSGVDESVGRFLCLIERERAEIRP